jgi:hypothetical protein
VKVLLDECVDWRLSRDVTGHEVKTARHVPELLAAIPTARTGEVTYVGG